MGRWVNFNRESQQHAHTHNTPGGTGHKFTNSSNSDSRSYTLLIHQNTTYSIYLLCHSLTTTRSPFSCFCRFVSHDDPIIYILCDDNNNDLITFENVYLRELPQKVILRNVSVVLCPCNGSQCGSMWFGYQYSSKHILLWSAKESQRFGMMPG